MGHELWERDQFVEQVQRHATLGRAAAIGQDAVGVDPDQPSLRSNRMHENEPVILDQAAQFAGRRREARRLDLDQLVVADDIHDEAVDALLDPIAGSRVESLQRGVKRTLAVCREPRRRGHAPAC